MAPDMTVRELIDRLSTLPDGLKVAIAEPAAGQPNGLVVFRHVEASDEDDFIELDYPTQEDEPEYSGPERRVSPRKSIHERMHDAAFGDD